MFKVGDEVFHSWFGCGVVTAAESPYVIDVTFAQSGSRPINPKELRMAVASDADWGKPRIMQMQDEEGDALTLVEIEASIESWGWTVEYYAQRFDTDDDFHHEVFGRYGIACALLYYQKTKQVVPAALLQRLAEIDQRFIEITIETDYCWMNTRELYYDKADYWYLYRYPHTM